MDDNGGHADVLEAVQADWRKRMEGRVYRSPLPADLQPPLDQLKRISQ